MPMYEYVHVDGDVPDCDARFEVMQRMSDPPLTECPKCGRPCRRVFSSFGVVGSERDLMSNKNLEAKGFTKYVKSGDGIYEKTAGKGPNVIGRDG